MAPRRGHGRTLGYRYSDFSSTVWIATGMDRRRRGAGAAPAASPTASASPAALPPASRVPSASRAVATVRPVWLDRTYRVVGSNPPSPPPPPPAAAAPVSTGA
jgi:hypothetical protein